MKHLLTTSHPIEKEKERHAHDAYQREQHKDSKTRYLYPVMGALAKKQKDPYL